MKGKHKKHPPADRLKAGFYHPNEIGIYGTDCGSISELVKNLTAELSDLHCLYVDADHNSSDDLSNSQNKEKQFHYSFTQEVHHQDNLLQSNAADVVFVNGNHYPADKQLVVINPAKEASLKRRIDQLTSVKIVIVEESRDEIFPFLKEKMDDDTKVIKKSDFDQLVKSVTSLISRPTVKALILAGGKSLRMGENKSDIEYHGKPQSQHLHDLCLSCGIETYYSVAHDDASNSENVLKDRFVNMGPLGAICTAFMHDRHAAWLVIACDMPFVDKTSIEKLLSERNGSLYATSYSKSMDVFPEPTFSIYEPKSYQRMMEFISLGYTCPRKVLINSDIKKVVAANEKILSNINTPEEKQQAFTEINPHE